MTQSAKFAAIVLCDMTLTRDVAFDRPATRMLCIAQRLRRKSQNVAVNGRTQVDTLPFCNLTRIYGRESGERASFHDLRNASVRESRSPKAAAALFQLKQFN